MPELPEVEVTRRQLAPLLVGRRIARVVHDRAELLLPDAARARCGAGCAGRRCEALDRARQVPARAPRRRRAAAAAPRHDRPALRRGRRERAAARVARAGPRSRPRRSSPRSGPTPTRTCVLRFDDGGARRLLPRRAQVRQGPAAARRASPRSGSTGSARDALAHDGRAALRRDAQPPRGDQDRCCSTSRCSPASATSTRTRRSSWPACGPRGPPRASLREECERDRAARSARAAPLDRDRRSAASATTCSRTAATAPTRTSGASTAATASRARAAARASGAS